MSDKKHTIATPPKILVVADDLTGAVDTGAQFSRRNLRTMVITGHENLSKNLKDCDVLVIDTESRYDSKEEAYRKAFGTGLAASNENIKYLYKKIDSTMRGNPGAEISGLMDSLDISHSFIVPALPLYGRTTINGNVYVKGVLLAETDYAGDPKNPVKESHIPSIISAQTDKKTGVISFNELHEGRQVFIARLQEMMDAGIQIIVIDSEDDEDLDLVASVLAKTEGRVMFSGCSGLAEKLAVFIDLDKEKKSSVVIAGSVNKTTISQAEHASKEQGIKMIDIDPGMILSGQNEKEKRRIMDIASEVISTGDDLIIRSISSSDTVKKWLIKGNELGMDDLMVSDAIAGFLGSLAAEIISRNNLKGVVLTGGDTAIHTLHSLNVSGIIVKDEILHGIPSGRFTDDKYRDLIVVTKAGGFGEEDALIKILKYLRDV